VAGGPILISPHFGETRVGLLTSYPLTRKFIKDRCPTFKTRDKEGVATLSLHKNVGCIFSTDRAERRIAKLREVDSRKQIFSFAQQDRRHG